MVASQRNERSICQRNLAYEGLHATASCEAGKAARCCSAGVLDRAALELPRKPYEQAGLHRVARQGCAAGFA